jgi:hypothetical protein
MDKRLKILAAGVAIASGLAAFCAISNGVHDARRGQEISSLESTIAVLKAKCEAQSEENTKSGTGWGHAPLVCDPKELSRIASPLGVIQKEIAAQQIEINEKQQYYPMELPYLIALAIILIAGLPWSWYFLLRRIRELSDAIRGR